MNVTRARAAAVVVGALVLAAGLAGCGPSESCDEQDRKTLAELRAVWPDELGPTTVSGGACDGDDPMWLSGNESVSDSYAEQVLTSHGWTSDPDYADDDSAVFRLRAHGHDYLFWLSPDGEIELDSA